MKLSIREIVIFGMLGGVIAASKMLMEFLPNIHLIGVFIVAMTVVYRWKALYPIYVFVMIIGLLFGFSTWWIPYLYIWLPLWGVTMLLPQKMSPKVAVVVYCIVNALHGLCYGTLYAPFQAIISGFSFRTTIAWIVAGLPWDCVHSAGNLVGGLLIVPLIRLLRMCNKILDNGSL